MPSLVDFSPVVLEKKIFKCQLCIFTISFISSLGKGCGPSLDQAWVLVTRWCVVSNLFEIGPVFLKENIFKILSMYFRYFDRYKIPFLRNLNPLPTRMSWFKLGWNWPSGSGGESVKCVQTDGQTDGQTDRRTTSTGDQKSSIYLLAHMWAIKLSFFSKTKQNAFFF